MFRFTLPVLLSLSFVAGCDSRGVAVQYTAVDRDQVDVVKLKESVRFANQVHPKGRASELIRLSGGKKIVMMPSTQYNDDLLVSAVGPLLTTTNTWAVEVDKDLCTTGNAAVVTGRASPREGKSIGMFEGYSLSDPAPVFGTDGMWSARVSDNIDPYFCFEPV
jgi:hypothetical protein